MFRKFVLGLYSAILTIGLNMSVIGNEAAPECSTRQNLAVHFRDNDSRDILEVMIGDGPCYIATMSIVLRTEHGDVLYNYVEKFKKHTAVHWEEPELAAIAYEFVGYTLENSMSSSASLPTFSDADQFYEESFCSLQISEKEYQELRARNRPVLWHRTHYEEWRYVAYDERTGKAETILECRI